MAETGFEPRSSHSPDHYSTKYQWYFVDLILSGDDHWRDRRLQLLPEVRSPRQNVSRRRRLAARQEQELPADRPQRHLLLHLQDRLVPSRKTSLMKKSSSLRVIAWWIKHLPGTHASGVQTQTQPTFIVLLSSRVAPPCALSLTIPVVTCSRVNICHGGGKKSQVC